MQAKTPASCIRQIARDRYGNDHNIWAMANIGIDRNFARVYTPMEVLAEKNGNITYHCFGCRGIISIPIIVRKTRCSSNDNNSGNETVTE